MSHSKILREEEDTSPKTLGRSVKGSADRSGLSRTALYNAHRRGELVFRKIGTRTLILEEDLVAFLRNLPRKDTALSEPHRARVLQRWQKKESGQ